MANVVYQCPTCGAELGWSAELQTWHCEYCEGNFTLEQLNEALNKKAEMPADKTAQPTYEEVEKGMYTQSNDGTEGTDLVEYACSHCGAEIITDRDTAATICPFCQNPIIMAAQISGKIAPKWVIPFRIDRKYVQDAYRKFSKKPLTPKDFRMGSVPEKIQGVYIPFWLYSGRSCGEMDAEGVNTRTWTSGDRRYTERKYYAVERKGHIGFSNVPADASGKTEDAAMDSIEPFDMREIKEFNIGYLAGYYAERYDVSCEECFSRVKLRMENTTKSELENTAHYDSLDVNDFHCEINIEKQEYALFPVWLLKTVYKGTAYTFAMNGQTGKFIGNLPISKAKLTGFSLLGAVVGFLLGAAVYYLTNS